MKQRPFFILHQAGFTLLEIAIVMIIIGVLAGGGISLIKILTERKGRTETIDYLKQTRLALISYGASNGRLPWADSDSDGLENNGSTSGTLPYLTLQIAPTDAYQRNLRYEVNTNLVTNRSTTCAALKAGLTVRPMIVDGDGSGSAFAVAAVLVSAGTMDADSDTNVFDAITTGTHQGNNVSGTPNYLRYPPVATFDDLTFYISGNVLFVHLCEYLDLAVNNNSGATVYVYDVNQGSDIGSIPNSGTGLYNIISGTRVELWSAAGGASGGGVILPSTPQTPITLAGQGATLNLP